MTASPVRPSSSKPPAERVSEKTRRREALRPKDEVEILKLARELDRLSERFPRFANRINRLTYLVRFQLRPLGVKRELIKKALREGGMLEFSEIIDDTGLDDEAATLALQAMKKSNEVELCTRDGATYVAPAHRKMDRLGRPVDSWGRPGAAGRTLLFRLTQRTPAAPVDD